MKYRNGEIVERALWNMTPAERERYEKTLKKFNPKSIFQEQKEPPKRTRLADLEPNKVETKEIIKRMYRDPNATDLWDDIGKDGNK